VDYSGKVGIGTVNPRYTLDVECQGSAYAPAARFLSNNDSLNWARIDIANNNIDSGISGLILYQDATGGAQIRNIANASLSFATNNAEKMRIDSDGNVGIGLSNPTTPLQVDGVSKATTLAVGDTSGSASFTAGTISTDANWGMFFTANTGQAQAAFRWDTSVGTEAMRIDANGSITIAKSAVAGRQVSSISGNISIDFASYQNFIFTLTGNVTLISPTSMPIGQSGFITFIQGGSSANYTVSLTNAFETAGGAGLSLSAGDFGLTDIVPYIIVGDGRVLLGTPQLNFS
jgi:hypothetical protein